MATTGPRDTTSAIVASKVYATANTSQLAQVVCGPSGETVGIPTATTVTSGNLTALNSAITFDPTNYRMMYFAVTGTFNLTFTLEVTYDSGGTWTAYPYHVVTTYTTIWQTANTGSGTRFCEFWGAANMQMRVRCSAYTSGTGAVVVVGCSAATFPSMLNTVGYVQGYQDHDAAISAQPVLVSGRGSRAIQAAVSADGDVTYVATDRSGRVITTQADSFTRISTATTTVVKAAPGKLQRIIINKTLTGAVTVYDNTSAAGTVIATFAIGTTPNSIHYGVLAGTGITVVTGAADDVTVTYAD